MLAAIPYQTFPTIGPLRTFGLMVGLAVLAGSWVAANHAERFGVSRDDIYRQSTRMVVAGVIGARLTWDVTHWDQIDTPLDLIAVWEGGLQFSGGFIFAVLVGLPTFLKWDRLTRWRVLDGAAMGLAIGVVFGRVGCTAVGEHFGGETTFPLAVRWEGSGIPDVREPLLGLDANARPVAEGVVFHNTAIYEMIGVLILFIALRLLYRRGVGVGTLIGVYLLAYAPMRFVFDALRVNDERVGGLTGAQWMCIGIVPIAFWILIKVRPQVRELELAETTAAAETTVAAAADVDTDVDDIDDVSGADIGADVGADDQSDADIGADVGADDQSDADIDADIGADVGADDQSDADIGADIDADVGADDQSDADVDADVGADIDADLTADRGIETETDPTAETGIETEMGIKTDIDASTDPGDDSGTEPGPDPAPVPDQAIAADPDPDTEADAPADHR